MLTHGCLNKILSLILKHRKEMMGLKIIKEIHLECGRFKIENLVREGLFNLKNSIGNT